MSVTAAQRHSEQEEISINLTRLDARVGVLENGLTSLGVKIDSLSSLFNASRQTNWGSIIGIATLLLGLIGGAWVIIDLKSQNALIPVLVQNAISTKEREELMSEVIRHRSELAETRSEMSTEKARRTAELIEQETQFAAAENKVNASVAELHRILSVVWNKNPDLGTYPSGPFYFSNISQHNR